MILGKESPDTGSIRFGLNTRAAYFDQARAELDPALSVYETIGPDEWVTVGDRRVHSRSYLESFLFPTWTHDMRVGSLSGGERNRLQLACLLLEKANLLILDEPTNDLDLPTLQVLESALAEFAGSVLVVTHDRFFLDKVATGLLVFESSGVVHRHEGGYDLYRRQLEARQVEAAVRTEPRRALAPALKETQASKPKRLSYQEKRELAGIEDAILVAEAERDGLGERLSDPALYVDTPGEVGSLRERFVAAEGRVADLYTLWAELEALSDGI
jgi:ATP-binding cassette subfamily F protein uup